MKYLLSLLVCLCLVGSVSAQKTSKAEKAVYELTNSGLLDEYRNHRRQIEKHIALFKTKEDEISASDWIEMRAAYQETAEAFEKFIYQIRNDLLDPKERKKIRKKTDEYVQEHIETLNAICHEHYTQKFLPTYISLSPFEEDEMFATRRVSGGGATVFAALLVPVTQATMKVIDYVDDRGEEKLENFKEVLEEEWVKPNQFKTWEEIR